MKLFMGFFNCLFSGLFIKWHFWRKNRKIFIGSLGLFWPWCWCWFVDTRSFNSHMFCRIQGRYLSTLQSEDNHGDNEPDNDPDNSPGVHTREVGPGAVHPEAGDRHHGPDPAQLGGEHRAPGVPVTRVPCAVTRTHLAIMTINDKY